MTEQHSLSTNNKRNEIIVIEGEKNTRNIRILVLRSVLRLECAGLKGRGKSVYSIIKKEFGFKGNKKRVLDQLNSHINENILPEERNDEN